MSDSQLILEIGAVVWVLVTVLLGFKIVKIRIDAKFDELYRHIDQAVENMYKRVDEVQTGLLDDINAENRRIEGVELGLKYHSTELRSYIDSRVDKAIDMCKPAVGSNPNLK